MTTTLSVVAQAKARARQLTTAHPGTSYTQWLERLAREAGYSCWTNLLAQHETPEEKQKRARRQRQRDTRRTSRHPTPSTKKGPAP